MKSKRLTPMIILVIEFYFLRICEIMLDPFRDMPGPELNNTYDNTML